MSNWKPQVKVNGQWQGNALVFATRVEAFDNAHDLMMRWMLVEDSRAIESDDPVNYAYSDRGVLTPFREPVQLDLFCSVPA